LSIDFDKAALEPARRYTLTKRKGELRLHTPNLASGDDIASKYRHPTASRTNNPPVLSDLQTARPNLQNCATTEVLPL